MENQAYQYMNHCSLWDEIKYRYTNLVYSPFGSSTNEVPQFHRKNLKEIAENLPSIDFQYNIFSEGLRESVLNHFPNDFFERTITKDEIIVTPGAVKAIHLILTTFITEPEDELIVFQPFYLCHSTDLLWRGFKNIRLANRYKDFSIDFEDLEKKLNEKTKILIIVNPDNPTTHLHSEEELSKLSDLLEKFPRVMVIEDMAYFAYLVNEVKLKSFSSLKNNREKTFTVFSGGKLFNITGLRCGWTIGPSDCLKKLQYSIEMSFSFTSPIESLCIASNLKSSLERFAEFPNFYEWVRQDQNQRFEYIINFLKDFDIKVIKPQGTYYMIIDVSAYRGKLPEKFFYTINEKKELKKNLDMAFCRMLMEERIGLLPLSCASVGIEDCIDSLIRVSCNRSYSDLDFFRDVLIKLKNDGLIF
jgi:aspartate/methionine/tyrosine aminotransferase